MKRRALSMALALILVICMFPVSAIAAQDHTTSDAAVSLIKHFEGFSKYPYWDYGQYTVGYGTRCPDDKVSYYMTYGISEYEATVLLKKFIRTFEGHVNYMDREYGLNLTQNEFDALVLFTYNVGQGWIYDESNLITQAVINGDMGNDFIFALTRWGTAGGKVNSTLVNRRLVEANMYLNGDYSALAPSNYSYVTFSYIDAIYNGESMTVKIQGYDAADPDEVRPQAVRSGYRFLGWYTAASGGKWVSHLDSSTNGKMLYPHWQSGDGNVSGGVIKGTAASYDRTASGSVNVYAKPSASSAVKYTLSSGTKISVVADYVDASGNKWGKLADGYWVDLGKTEPVLNPAEDSTGQGQRVVVTANMVNVRSGPGTGYSRIGYAYKGDELLITSIHKEGNNIWGQFSDGWICLEYTDYVPVVNDSVIATGTVNASGGLNVRKGAGTGYDIVCIISRGTKVEIYEFATVNGSKWGRIDKGWIYMSYVDLDETVEVPTEKPTEKPTEAPTEKPTEKPTEAPTEKPTEKPTEAPTEKPTEKPTQPPVSEDKGDKVIATGKVNITSGSLNVRSGAGTGYSIVGSLKKGEAVKIYETKTVSGTQWGRISENGWVSMTYIKLDAPASSETEKPKYQTGTVSITSGYLNVRSGPGSGYSVVGSLKKGETVKIYETKAVGSTTWGRMDKGWVSMDYIKLTESAGSGSNTGSGSNNGSGSSSGSDSGSNTGSGNGSASGSGSSAGKEETVTASARTGIVVNCGAVNIRSGPSSSYSNVGTFKAGTKLSFTELKMVSGTPWGKTSSGWVCLNYVEMDDPTVGSQVLITAYSMNVRSGAGTSHSKVGTFTRGDVITILETTMVGTNTWARSDKGWFTLSYSI